MEEKLKPPKPLWTRDFTIITLGSTVSLLGNALSGFALSLLVLDYTSSSLLYAVYLAVYTLPQILVPLFSGPVLDRFSRKKTIYTLDFISAGLYSVFGIILKTGWFSFPVLAIVTFLIGSINSMYIVAYESFYPLLISEGNFSKAYSISSVLETLSSVMIPVSAFLYNLVGIFPLLEITAVFFLIAAVVETMVTAEEKYIEERKNTSETKPKLLRQLTDDLKEGLSYIICEKGLLAVTLYFTVCFFSYGASNVIVLPYFKGSFPNGEYVYMLVFGMSVVGRAIGGSIHYRTRLPVDRKFSIALTVYIAIALIDAFYLYLPVPVMMGLCLIEGLLGVTSYTIRISATQSYVPDEKKGRFNGVFNMLITAGSLLGELLTGVMTVYFPVRYVLTGFMLFNGLMAVLIIGGNKNRVSAIFNREQ